MNIDGTSVLQQKRVWFGPRFVGLIIDYLVFGVVWIVAGFSVMTSSLPPHMQTPVQPGVMPIEMQVVFRKMAWLGLSFNIAIFVYLVVMEAWRGATIGKGLTGIRTVALSNPERRGLPFAKALLREFIKVAGFIPTLIIIPIIFGEIIGIAEAMQPLTGSNFDAWFIPLQLVAQFLPLGWLAWIGVSLANNRDPIYDRMAGTTVVRA